MTNLQDATSTTKHPPGPSDDTWLDHFSADRMGTLQRAVAEHGGTVRLPIGRKRALYVITLPEDLRYVLIDHVDQFTHGTVYRRRASRVLRNGLMMVEENSRQRRMMMPAFHHQKIASYEAIMIQELKDMLKQWHDGQTRDIQKDMVHLAMNIVTKCLFGADLFGREEELATAITKCVEYLNDETLPEPTNAIVSLDTTINRIITERREQGVAGDDLLSMLIQARNEDDGEPLKDAQIRDELVAMFLAGHETSANALTWTLHLLSRNTTSQSILANILRTQTQSPPTLRETRNIPYLDQTIKEGLRLYAPIWNLTREPREDVTLGEYEIPRGSVIIISPYIIHHLDAYWPEPERFEPLRFTPESETQIVKGTYLPFSYGAHNCIGQIFANAELSLVLGTLIRDWEFTPTTEGVIEIEQMIALRPKGGMPLTIRKRQGTRIQDPN